jgi:hypothetical protein
MLRDLHFRQEWNREMISFELAKKLKDAGFPQSEFPRAQQKIEDAHALHPD